MQSIAAMRFDRFNLTLSEGSSFHRRGELVTGNYFRTIGVRLALSREFTRDDARGAAPLAAILTDAVCRMQFHRRADILGQSVRLNGLPATIGGVAPPRFHGTTFAPNLEICVPIMTSSRVLTAVSLAACWLPARRAARIDPMVALRQD